MTDTESSPVKMDLTLNFVPLQVLSAHMILFRITLELSVNSQNVWWIFMVGVLFAFSFKYFPKKDDLKDISKNIQAFLGATGAHCYNFILTQDWDLTLPMLRVLSSKAQGCKDFWKTSKPCHVGIHLKALAEYSHMSTHVPGFQSFFIILHNFVLAKVATSSNCLNTW